MVNEKIREVQREYKGTFVAILGAKQNLPISTSKITLTEDFTHGNRIKNTSNGRNRVAITLSNAVQTSIVNDDLCWLLNLIFKRTQGAPHSDLLG